MLRFSSVIQVRCNWYRMGAIVLTAKKNNCTASLLEAVSRFILRKNLFIKSNYKSIGETPNKNHLLQSNLLGIIFK